MLLWPLTRFRNLQNKSLNEQRAWHSLNTLPTMVHAHAFCDISQQPHIERISNSSEKQHRFLRTTRRTFLASLLISHAVVLESRKWLGQGSHI
jgi:hypothetical protein